MLGAEPITNRGNYLEEFCRAKTNVPTPLKNEYVPATAAMNAWLKITRANNWTNDLYHPNIQIPYNTVVGFNSFGDDKKIIAYMIDGASSPGDIGGRHAVQYAPVQ
ncbi:hypothetical protein AGMMS49525_06300 [Bacteroidia bacterium]|nr:hypothetical protein AGMMS49525_06300 [Bacteroidia bacterium]